MKRLILIATVMFLVSGTAVAQAERAFAVKSDPPGASVELIGADPTGKPIMLGTTPLLSALPSFYFEGPTEADLHYLSENTSVLVSKEGYQPQLIRISRGPLEWTSQDGQSRTSYFKLIASEFTVKLEAVLGSSLPNYRPPPAFMPQAGDESYQRAPEAVEQKARQILEQALAAQTPISEPGSVMVPAIFCGPQLWNLLKDDRKVARAATVPVSIVDPNTYRQQEARAILKPAAQVTFWNAFIETIRAKNPVIIRRASSPEFSYFRPLIPFKIEAPLFVADMGNRSVLFYFGSYEGKAGIFWIELV
jgi:cellobiose-specific phosphotransferase system component IIB